MSLSLYGVPDGQQKGQSVWPCPSVYSPATALASLSSVALSSAPAPVTLAQRERRDANYHHFFTRIWSGFLVEATNPISSGFLREATGNAIVTRPLDQDNELPVASRTTSEKHNGGRAARNRRALRSIANGNCREATQGNDSNKALNSKACIGDLLQDIENGSTKLESVKSQDLPSELQKLSAQDGAKDI